MMHAAIQILSPDNDLFIVAKSDAVSNALANAMKKVGWWHVNRKELLTQLAVIKHFERDGNPHPFLILNDDHWGVTKQAFFELFEQGTAVIRDRIGQRCILVGNCKRSAWADDSAGYSNMRRCGEQYSTNDGEVVLRWVTAIS